MQPPQNKEVNPAGANERRSKKRHEVNIAAVQPPQNTEVNDAAVQLPQSAEINPAATIEPHGESSILNAEIIADAASAPLHPPLENPVAAAPIETLPPTTAPAGAPINQLPKNAATAVDPPSQGVAAAMDGVLVTPPDSGIEVIQATSTEEELIRREMSESIDPKENVPTDKEVQEEINSNIMMIAKMAVAQSEMGPLPSFDLGIDFGSQSQSQSQPEKEKEPEQETKKLDQDVQKLKSTEIQQHQMNKLHQGPEIKTPEEAIQKREDMRALCYKWATKPEGNNEY
ncbi:hypothetical protein PIB30_100824 [Stylosanthes scabra]|uniref:Uncharacterized protein n=1 Tax=Stylosanthes scabra TaxID=79078 RepID=A0ABU6RXX4_9FABA|nr:hypothetical protein [Stylosanthes scabra]